MAANRSREASTVGLGVGKAARARKSSSRRPVPDEERTPSYFRSRSSGWPDLTSAVRSDLFGSPYFSGRGTQFGDDLRAGGGLGRRLVVVVPSRPPAAALRARTPAAAGWTRSPSPARASRRPPGTSRPAGSPRTSGCRPAPITTTVPYTTGLPLYVTFPVTSVGPAAAPGQRPATATAEGGSKEARHSEITSPIARVDMAMMIVVPAA